MSRDWRLRVEDILAAAERAIRFVGEMDLAAFKADERTAAAVLHQIFLIGEAAARLPEVPGNCYRTGSNAVFRSNAFPTRHYGCRLSSHAEDDRAVT